MTITVGGGNSGGLAGIIDDSSTVTNKTWSSSKISSEIAASGGGPGTTVKGLKDQRPLGYISITEFGATDSSTVSSDTAITNAIAACAAGDTLLFPTARNGWLANSPVTVPVNINVVMDGPLIYGGSTGSALTIGDASKGTPVVSERVVLKLRVKKKTISNWSDNTLIGIRMVNVQHSNEISVLEVSGFTIGVQCRGDGGGFAYNTVSLGEILNNKIGVQLTNGIASSGGFATGGYANENLFIGGNFAAWSSTNTTVSRYGVHITRDSNSVYFNNNSNIFIKPSFELSGNVLTGGAEAIPVWMEHGSENKFERARHEFNNGAFARIDNQSHDNHFDLSYSNFDPAYLDEKTTGYFRSNFLTQTHHLPKNIPSFTVFSSGALYKNAIPSGTAGAINIKGVDVLDSSLALVRTLTGTINADHLDISGSSSLAITVDTTQIKKFLFRRNCLSGFGGRVLIKPYDASGAALTDDTLLRSADGLNTPITRYLRSQPGHGMYWDTYVGGIYTESSDNTEDLFFAVEANVAKIVILIRIGSANLKIRSFSLQGYGHGDAPVSLKSDDGQYYASTAPTAGTYERGQRVYNAVPSTGTGTEGWICTVAGTPGTWKGFGTIA